MTQAEPGGTDSGGPAISHSGEKNRHDVPVPIAPLRSVRNSLCYPLRSLFRDIIDFLLAPPAGRLALYHGGRTALRCQRQ